MEFGFGESKTDRAYAVAGACFLVAVALFFVAVEWLL